MTKRIGVAVVFGALACGLWAQTSEALRVPLIVDGQSTWIATVEQDGEFYWSVADLFAALPRVFQIQGDQIVVNPQVGQALSGTSGRSAPGGTLIEARIDGTFEGWSGDTLFPLTNGQVWQQVQYDYTYSYRYRPNVWIIGTGSRWLMFVEGEAEPLAVRRLR